MRFPTCLRWLASLAALLASSATTRAQAPPSGLGTATIDGVRTPGEWDDAATADVSIRNADGQVVTPATFYLMNDASNLYVALRVAGSAARMIWTVQFDRDLDGRAESGDDVIGIDAGVFLDRVLRDTRAGTVEPADDTAGGGTRDGAGALRLTAGETVFEIAHPLASGDAADFNLAPGGRLGLRSSLKQCDTCPASSWPSASQHSPFGIGLSGPSFSLAFDGPYITGKVDRAGVDCLIHENGIPAGEEGVNGWSLSIAEEGGCRITSATTAGTDAAPFDAFPPGLWQDGFLKIDLTNGAGNEGVVAACVLSLQQPVSFDPADSPHRVLRLEVAPNGPGCQDCGLVYRDNLQGSGMPVKNLLTRLNASRVPTLPPPLTFSSCDVESCYPSSPPPGGWVSMDLGNAAGGSSRNPLKGVFELCSLSTGYGGTSDSLRLVTQPFFWPFVGIRARLEELSPGGQAGVEMRRGSPIAADAACLRLTAHRAAASSGVTVTAGIRAQAGGAFTQVRLEAQAAPGELELPITLQLLLSSQGGISARVLAADGTSVRHANVDFDTESGNISTGLATASADGSSKLSRFCVNNAVTGSSYDTDGDGCPDCIDEHPDHAFVIIGQYRGPCCTGVNLYYHFEGQDSDGDGLLDCGDPDDDDDGIPDGEDPCRLGGACDSGKGCCLREWTTACPPFDCGPYFLKVLNQSQPPRELVFHDINIVNQALYLRPLPGASVPQSAAAIFKLGASGNGGGAGGLGTGRVSLELWRGGTDAERARLIARIGDIDLSTLDLEAVEDGRLLYLAPPLDGEPAKLGGVWVIGQPIDVLLPDADGDGIPNPFDNCPDDFNPGQEDLDGDGRGDVCELISTVGRMLPGDGNRDGQLDLSDGVQLLGILFSGVGTPPCGNRSLSHPANIKLLDSNGDTRIDLSDAISVFAYLFLGAPPPVRGTECIWITDCPFACFGS
jgi:hypothetical protein